MVEYRQLQDCLKKLLSHNNNSSRNSKNVRIDNYETTLEQQRLRVMELFEDMLVSTEDALMWVKSKEIDELVWSSVFYSRIKELKGAIGKVYFLLNLLNFLSLSIC